MTLPTITEPPGTPCFLGEGHAIDEDSVFAQVGYTTGHSRARRVWTVSERVVAVSKILEADEMAVYEDWYETALLAGTRQFAAEVRNQGDGALKLWWTARWIDFQTEMLHLGRGRVSGHLFLTGEGSETPPETGALAMEVIGALLDVRSNVSVPQVLAMEVVGALLQPQVLRMEVIGALLSSHETADARFTEEGVARVTEDGIARFTEG